MSPDRASVEGVLGRPLLDWQWNTLLGILGHLPERPPHDSHDQLQDAITRTCELCGRVGTRRYIQTETGWRCAPSAKCLGRAPRHEPGAAAEAVEARLSEAKPPTSSDIPAKSFQTNVTPPKEPAAKAAAPKPIGPPITARCQDCTRVWNLTGRVLEMAVQLHEHKAGHIVDILATATPGGDA